MAPTVLCVLVYCGLVLFVINKNNSLVSPQSNSSYDIIQFSKKGNKAFDGVSWKILSNPKSSMLRFNGNESIKKSSPMFYTASASQPQQLWGSKLWCLRCFPESNQITFTDRTVLLLLWNTPTVFTLGDVERRWTDAPRMWSTCGQ